MSRYWKWRRTSILLDTAEKLEVVEIPVYQSTGGPLFKTLYSSACRMDCLYCPLSYNCYTSREFWRRDKLIRVFIEAYKQRKVRGLFLSSGLYADPERVSEELVEIAVDLRRIGYNGYIHVRLMPGTPKRVIREALKITDRIGINLEAPGPSYFQEIAPSKGRWRTDLLSKLELVAREARKPLQVDTQFVLGGAGEPDIEYIALIHKLVKQKIGRIHFSPYTPIPGTKLAEINPHHTPQWRAKYLYEIFFLIKYYGFKPSYFIPLLDDKGCIPPSTMRIKDRLAELHPEWFPINLDTASFYELLKVPGIGPVRARRIINLREKGVKLTPRLIRHILGSAWRKAQKYLDLSTQGETLLEK